MPESLKAIAGISERRSFANTPRYAKASAIIYSLVETAKENGLNPFVYLTDLFVKLPNLA